MNLELPTKSMPEAEVTLLLALALLREGDADSFAQIAIDGAHVRIKAHKANGQWIAERIIFDIAGFLKDHGCTPVGPLQDGWQENYTCGSSSFEIKARQGFDVEVNVAGRPIKVECKGGPLEPIKVKSPNAIIATAVGQVICENSVGNDDELWVAVPDSAQFQRATERIIAVPVFCKSEIKIALVSREGGIRLARPSNCGVAWVDSATYFSQHTILKAGK